MKEINLNDFLLKYAVREVKKQTSGKSPEKVLTFAARLLYESMRKEFAVWQEVAKLIRAADNKEKYRRLISVLEWKDAGSTEKQENLEQWADEQL